jgi:hypothetical protein
MEEEKIEKIVVKAQDELIDVVRKISNTEVKKILVTFVEDSDILISSINLKVLLDSADEKNALLVLQIPNNPTGVRNARATDIPVLDTPGLPSAEVWQEAKNLQTNRLERTTQSKKPLPQDYKSENITSFEQRINSVLDKSQVEREESKDKKTSDIVVDKDITEKESVQNPDQEDFTKVDFKNPPKPAQTKSSSIKIFSNIGAFFAGLTKNFKKGDKKQLNNKSSSTPTKKKFIQILPKLLIPLVIVIFLFAFLYYKFAPYVRATIFIESKPVEIEKTFTGSENINEIDFQNGEIPIKKESVTKSVSDTVQATGVAYRGEKATGTVTISYINTSPGGCTDADEPINLSQGQSLSAGDKNYVLTQSLTVECNIPNNNTSTVEAVEVGEEYNIASGKYFSLSGYDSNRVYAVNSNAFTGGSKEEYTVLSKQDVDKKVTDLTEIAKAEAENSLKDIGSGWQIIESTIEVKVKEGSIDTAVAIGSEATTSDISLEVEGSATYYYTAGVDAGLNNLLTEAAINQNLFESDEGLNLTLKGDIEKNLEVKEKDDKVEVILTASSSVEPAVNKEDLVNKLKGMNWEEGTNYLKDLSFTADKDPIIVFTPEGFPFKLRHFPSRQGRINIVVEQIVKEN